MNPHDALWQQQLLRANLTKPTYREYLHRFAEDVKKKKSGPIIVDKDGKVSGDVLAASQVTILERAETYYVSADMTDVMLIASQSLDGLDRFAQDLWPTPDGFLLFQRGMINVDVWGRNVSCKALVWNRQSIKGRPGTMVNLYADLDDERDSLHQNMDLRERDQMGASMGRLSTSEIYWFADDQRVGPPEVPVDEEYAQYADPEYGHILSLSTGNPARPILALLMLLNQTIVDLAHHDLRPTNPKRARKMKVPGQVTIVTLRHTKGSKKQEGESHIEWQHRWIVRGFWRSQACGPNYPMCQEVSPGVFRARIYISPYPKGPPDKPFRQTTKINSLIR